MDKVMKKLLTKILAVIIFGASFASCGKAGTIQLSPTEEKQTTSTTPPTIAPVTATSTQAGLEVPNFACTPNEAIAGWEISSNGKWMVAGTYLENERESLLQVVSLNCLKNWKIYLSNYKDKDSFDNHDGIIPYRWSKDGKFLYAILGSRFEGCCWIGGRYILLVQLDLETGNQIAILNTDSNSSETFDFTISDNDRYIIFTPPASQSFGFVVLDLNTWEKREFSLEFSKYLDVFYAVMSPDGNKIILPLFMNLEFNDYYVDSIVLIDLTTGKQELLISGLDKDTELYPIQWTDEIHVLISNAYPHAFHYSIDPPIEYWLLNINTGEREKVDKP